MIATDDAASHAEAWLSLPWLANGRLSQSERDRIEPHVRGCIACREELTLQRLLCNALTEPDRVTYAPGPSFRKLMERIDGTTPQARHACESHEGPTPPASPRRAGHISMWRPPGLAWAASFVLAVGLAGALTTVHRSSRPLYTTHTDVAPTAPDVLHIAFDRTVTIGEAEEVLRSTGARVVEGPDDTGIFGIAPVTDGGRRAAAARESQRLRVLSARLRADPRVRWVEPVPGDDSPAAAPTPQFPGP